MPTASNLSRLGKAFGDEVARWAFQQWELRKRARAKFAKAYEMLFDRDGLEMASHESMARMHAVQFPARKRVADLTCGIGADLVALAKENDAVGFEIDPVRAEMARHNLKVHGFEAEIREENCLQAKWDFEYAFADPSRRSDGKRIPDPSGYHPPLPELAKGMEELALGLIKVSPLLPDEALHQYGNRVDFLSFGGECREALLRVGCENEYEDGSDDNSNWALHVESGRWLCDQRELPDRVETAGAFLFEADPAAIRSHALGHLCQVLMAVPLGDSSGYLTGNDLACDMEGEAFAKPYKVLGFGRLDEKRIRQNLRKLDASIEAVKVRGVREDPIVWQKRLKSEGARGVILALYPVAKSSRYVLLERC